MMDSERLLANGIPIVQTGNATNIGLNTATLNGTIDPQGAITQYFWYIRKVGTTTWTTEPVIPPYPSTPTNYLLTPVSLPVSGLDPCTTYECYLHGWNSYGTADGLPSVNFTTLGAPLPVSVSIVPSSNPVCQGASVLFTANAVNGGSSPIYQWKVNGISVGTNSPVFNYIPVNNDAIVCVVNSSDPCATGSPATSNTITMTVNPIIPVSVTITASSNPSCLGSPVTFTAVPVNGGGSPVYQWKVNGSPVGTNTPTFTYVPANNDVVLCIVYSNAPCVIGSPATSNSITMTIGSSFPVSVTITASSNPICQGTSVTFTAVPVNGGSAPGFQWKVNGALMGSNSQTFTYVPANNDIVLCILTSSISCASGNPATSNSIAMTVNAGLPVSITITASSNIICQGTSVTFTAVPVNGGSAPVFQWKVNGVPMGSNSQTFIYVPANNDAVICILTSNASCAAGSPATSNTITMSVNPSVPVSISISVSSNPVAQGTPVTFTATPINGGSSPAYQWEVNSSPMGSDNPVFTYTPANNDVVNCMLTSDLTCVSGNPATSNSIVMIVNQNPPPPVITFNGNTLYSNVTDGNQWYLSGNAIPGATDSSYTATQTGWYWDVVTIYGLSSDTSNNIYLVVTGTHGNMDNSSYELFPVPNDGRFFISNFTTGDPVISISVFNNLGIKVYEDNNIKFNGPFSMSVDLQFLPNGVYDMIFINKKSESVKKFIVNK